MLDFSRVSIVESREYPVQTGYTVTAEGQGLSLDYTTAGVVALRPTAGDATDTFIGASLAQQLTITEFPEIISFVAADVTYTVPHTPIGGSILVFNDTAGTAIVFNAAVATGQYNLVGNVFSFNAAQVGAAIRIQYRYVPTTLEALSLQGDIPPGGAANLLLNTMGVILKGQIATSYFDSSVNWQVATPVLRTGAAGRLTLGGSGQIIPGAVIISVPTSADSFLVYEV